MASPIGFNLHSSQLPPMDNEFTLSDGASQTYPLESVAVDADGFSNNQRFQALIMPILMAAALSQQSAAQAVDTGQYNENEFDQRRFPHTSNILSPASTLESMNNGYGGTQASMRGARQGAVGGPHRFGGATSALDPDDSRLASHRQFMQGTPSSTGHFNRFSTQPQATQYSPSRPSLVRRRNPAEESQQSFLSGDPAHTQHAFETTAISSQFTSPRPESSEHNRGTSWLLYLSDKLNSTTSVGWFTAFLVIPMTLALGGAFIHGFHEGSPSSTSPFRSWFTSAFLYSSNNALTLVLDTYFTIAAIFKNMATIQRRHGRSAVLASKKRRGSFIMALVCSAFIVLLAVSSIVVAAFSQNCSSFILGIAGEVLSYLIYLEGVTANENEVIGLQAHVRHAQVGYHTASV